MIIGKGVKILPVQSDPQQPSQYWFEKYTEEIQKEKSFASYGVWSAWVDKCIYKFNGEENDNVSIFSLIEFCKKCGSKDKWAWSKAEWGIGVRRIIEKMNNKIWAPLHDSPLNKNDEGKPFYPSSFVIPSNHMNLFISKMRSLYGEDTKFEICGASHRLLHVKRPSEHEQKDLESKENEFIFEFEAI